MYRLSGARSLTGWTIDDSLFTGSDHRTIKFEIREPGRPRPGRVPSCIESWAVRKLDEAILTDFIRTTKVTRDECWLGADPDEAAERFHQYVVEGCRLSMPARRMAGRHRPMYWWNDNIAAKRRDCIAKRRTF